MNLLEIVLIIVGIIIIVISCKIVDNSQNFSTQTVSRNLTEVELKQMKSQIDSLLSETIDDSVQLTDDRLSKISNEKIMAVNDFSDQILEKIRTNHEEVVFLYNMLNDKEKELKVLLREINQSIAKSDTVGKLELDQMDSHEAFEKCPGQEVADENGTGTQDLNRNQEILNMYAKGMSVVDISRQLDLGQGEVKLVIELFHQRGN
jgi:Mor family transcriptional regulator